MMQKRAETRSPRSVAIVHCRVGLVERRGRHAGRELDVAAQVEAVGDVVDVAQDLGLRGVALGPLPLLLQLVGERVGVVHALDVAARARIAVPVPGAADAVARLEDARRQPEPAQAVEHVEPGEPRADDDRVDVRHAQTVAGWNSSVLPSGSLHSICMRPPGWVFSTVLDAFALQRGLHRVVVGHLEAGVTAAGADRGVRPRRHLVRLDDVDLREDAGVPSQ